ncbi:MAG: HAMP domain-containing protein [Cocleimonas sp.]|nr:HAMP domain-containing protein [Cocleimonas sp.]
MAATLRPFLIQAIPIGFVVALLTYSLSLLKDATDHPHDTSSLNLWLIPLNGFILIILSLLILYNLHKLVTGLKSHKTGSRYTARLVVAFSTLTIVPVLIVSFFSMNFLGDRIDTWFDVKIEGALQDSLELSNHALNVRMRQHLFELEQVAKEIVVSDPLDYPALMDRKRTSLGAYEMTLFGANNEVMVYSGDNTDTILPHFPQDQIFRSLSLHGYTYQLETTSDEDLYSRVALTLKPSITGQTIALTALFPFSENERHLTENVTKAWTQYKATDYNRYQIKHSFRLTLLLIMVLSILLAILAAFLYSQKLTEPIRKLFEGTLAVASGDLYKKLPVSHKDDFSLLAHSFNAMTAHLAEARKESERSKQQIQQQRDYLNIVLDHINSGVMNIDDQGIILRINSSAEQVLQTSLSEYIGKTCQQMCNELKILQPLFHIIEPHFENHDKEWQQEVNLLLPSGRQTLVCRGAKLPLLNGSEQGHVLVFDDITEVIQAEHDAAWSEVARRLAHEIKNPLTPIQLSAERLQIKLLPEVSEKSADLLKRMSKTIITQVDNMKTMVDAFSQYARAPAITFQRVRLNNLTREVSELYTINSQKTEIVLNLGEIPDLYLDETRIRQMMINLIKNALEAMPEAQACKQIVVSTFLQPEQTAQMQTAPCQNHVIIEVKDNGSGIAEDIIGNLFTPYVSSKTTGTGLGLSIVKKITEEHSGKVFATNNIDQGATMSICLPISQLSHS